MVAMENIVGYVGIQSWAGYARASRGNLSEV